MPGDLDAYFTNAGDFEFGHGFAGELNRFYMNTGKGKYVDLSQVFFPAHIDASTNAAIGDVDGDGEVDVVVANSGVQLGRERLYLKRYRKAN